MFQVPFTQSTTTAHKMLGELRPNHTIYINNLNEKLKKEGK